MKGEEEEEEKERVYWALRGVLRQWTEEGSRCVQRLLAGAGDAGWSGFGEALMDAAGARPAESRVVAVRAAVCVEALGAAGRRRAAAAVRGAAKRALGACEWGAELPARKGRAREAAWEAFRARSWQRHLATVALLAHLHLAGLCSRKIIVRCIHSTLPAPGAPLTDSNACELALLLAVCGAHLCLADRGETLAPVLAQLDGLLADPAGASPFGHRVLADLVAHKDAITGGVNVAT